MNSKNVGKCKVLLKTGNANGMKKIKSSKITKRKV